MSMLTAGNIDAVINQINIIFKAMIDFKSVALCSKHMYRYN